MAEKVLMKGNEAIAEGAIAAGCQCFFGYPITPQNEVPEHMSKRMIELGRVFLQAESEVAAINMVYGAAGAGARVMTSSSSPGISLKQEGISYIATAELPAVIVNVQRGGPGLGGLCPSQSDYFQATKGGGHGDYHLIVLAPSSVQELYDMVGDAFDLADKYRNPAMLLTDAVIGQMMEPVELKERKVPNVDKSWATTGHQGKRKHNIVNSLGLAWDELAEMNKRLYDKYETIKANEVRIEEQNVNDADLVVIAYGSSSRVAKSAIALARANGVKVGLLRPITLWPFPSKRVAELAARGKKFLVVEMSFGQMYEDVKLAVDGKAPVDLLYKLNGTVPSVEEVQQRIESLK